MFAVRGEPAFIRSDNGSEFASNDVKKWLKASGVKTLFVAPGSPWENGYVESFNSKLRDELINRELFLHIDELRYIADRWRMDYNHYRPHSRERACEVLDELAGDRVKNDYLDKARQVNVGLGLKLVDSP